MKVNPKIVKNAVLFLGLFLIAYFIIKDIYETTKTKEIKGKINEIDKGLSSKLSNENGNESINIISERDKLEQELLSLQ